MGRKNRSRQILEDVPDLIDEAQNITFNILNNNDSSDADDGPRSNRKKKNKRKKSNSEPIKNTKEETTQPTQPTQLTEELTKADIRRMKKQKKKERLAEKNGIILDNNNNNDNNNDKNDDNDDEDDEDVEVIKNETKLFSTFKDNNSDAKNIAFKDVTIVAHNKVLFTETPLTVSYGHKYGLIGKNGIGKSSLLKEIALRRIPVHESMDIYYMEQDIPQTKYTVYDTILMSNTHRYELIKESNRLNKLMEDETLDDETLNDVSDKYTKVMDELYAIGADKDESIVLKILLGLGFNNDKIYGSIKLLSGGWRMRVSLAKALYLEPTLLLLDEPTNHLDINATIWLTNYLSKWKNSLMVVSHNQHFLNEVCTDIINIENQKLIYYRGNYAMFKKMYKQRIEKLEKDWDKLQKHIIALRKKKEFTKGNAKDLLKEKEKEGIYKPPKQYSVSITFPEPESLARPVLEAHDVYFEYTPDQPIIKHMDMGIDMDTRMTIVGANGNGKTTVMNILIGLLNPTKGKIVRHNLLKIGYYNQHFVDTLPVNITPLEYLQSLDEHLTKQEAHKYLGSIGLESYGHILPINNLSGGQKARVVLASIQLEEPHLLFLDEPTNHLDIETIDALIDAINRFSGGVIVISHDMELITKTKCQLWVCDGGTISEFDGSYDKYYQHILDELDL